MGQIRNQVVKVQFPEGKKITVYDYIKNFSNYGLK